MKYSVAVPFHALVMVEVDADDPDQARDRASLQAQVTGQNDTNLQIGDVDLSNLDKWEVFPESVPVKEEEGVDHGWTEQRMRTRKAVREFLNGNE